MQDETCDAVSFDGRLKRNMKPVGKKAIADVVHLVGAECDAGVDGGGGGDLQLMKGKERCVA